MNKIKDNQHNRGESGSEASDAGKTGTEDRILRAAEREFFSKGYEGARTTAIAAEAGVTHAMLHYYFRTKEHLFDVLMADKISVIREILTGFLQTDDGSLSDRIRRGVERHFDLLAANPDLPLFVLGEAKRNCEVLKRAADNTFALLPEMLVNFQNQIDEGARRGENVQIDAFMLILDIVSLNLFAVMSLPLMSVIGLPMERNRYLQMRKEEVITTIMKRLKP